MTSCAARSARSPSISTLMGQTTSRHVVAPALSLWRTSLLQGPELDINYMMESSDLKVQNDGKLLKIVGFKASFLKYRTTTYPLEEVDLFHAHCSTRMERTFERHFPSVADSIPQEVGDQV